MNCFLHYESSLDIFQHHKAKKLEIQINKHLAVYCTSLLSLGAVLSQHYNSHSSEEGK